MNEEQAALSVTIEGTPDLPGEPLTALYRITGRSTVELRRSIRAGEAVYVAELYGSAHLATVPRFEKTIAYLDGLGLPLVFHETVGADRSVVTRDTVRAILG